MSDFNLAIPVVLENEGGYVNDPNDLGGETNYGISKRCLSPNTRVLTSDLQWVEAHTLTPGQELLAFDEMPERRGKLNIRRFKRSIVEAISTVILPSSRVTTDKREIIAGDDHLWLRRWGSHKIFDWCKTKDLLKARGKWTNGVKVLLASVFEPWEKNNSREAGYLAAVLDGEGHVGGSDISFSQKTGNPLVQQAQECAASLGFALKRGNERHGVSTYTFVNVEKTPYFSLQVAGALGARRLLHRLSDSLLGKSVASTYVKHDLVLDVESVGKQELIGLSTSTKTVIAEGLLTHNSYPDVDIKNLTVAQATAIYLRDFWKFEGIVDQGVATKVFDSYVNMEHTAIKILQTLLGLTADGVYGPNTEAAVNSRSPLLILNAYRLQLAQHYRNIVLAKPQEAEFLAGWLRRAQQ